MELLRRQAFDTDTLRSKSWNEFAAPGAPQLDFVFTVCDNARGEVCPIWPGQPMTAHWGMPDPAAADGNEAERRLAFAETLRMLNNRVSAFVNLPLKSLDKLSLQKQIDEIGRDLPVSGEGSDERAHSTLLKRPSERNSKVPAAAAASHFSVKDR